MTNVCFIAGLLGRGGAERQLVYMAAALQGSDVAVRVLCLTRGDPLQPELEAMGVPVTWVGQSESRATRVRAIATALRTDQPDIVQSTHFFTNIYAAVGGAAVRRPSIGAVRSDVAMEIEQAGMYGRAQIFLPRYLVANSRLGRERLIDAGRAPKRTFVVNNAVDTQRFSADKPRLDAAEARPYRLLFVGNMYRAKRVDRFLRLLHGLRRMSPAVEIEARVVGSGPLLAEMRQEAIDLGLDARTLVFEDDIPDTSGFYRWADVLVLTSDHEGTPNVVLEAMASGLPIVATTVGGVPDLLAHGGGLLVRPNDEEGLLRATLRLRENRALRDDLIGDGLRYVSANHSLDGLRRQLLSVWTAALADRPREPGS